VGAPAPPPWPELAGRTLGIVGYGRIGHAVARRARAFDMTVCAIRRDPARSADEDLALLGGPDRLDDVLRRSDYVALTLSLDASSRGLLGERELRLMKPSAFLINVARAEIVNEDALHRALAEGWIAGAALDVWYRYPAAAGPTVPAHRPFHELRNVLMTPHVSGWTDGMLAARAGVIAGNIARLERGEPPLARRRDEIDSSAPLAPGAIPKAAVAAPLPREARRAPGRSSRLPPPIRVVIVARRTLVHHRRPVHDARCGRIDDRGRRRRVHDGRRCVAHRRGRRVDDRRGRDHHGALDHHGAPATEDAGARQDLVEDGECTEPEGGVRRRACPGRARQQQHRDHQHRSDALHGVLLGASCLVRRRRAGADSGHRGAALGTASVHGYDDVPPAVDEDVGDLHP
jgi:hypothetical protein